MNSMETFDPDAECLVHDQLNNELIAWKPEWASDYPHSEFDLSHDCLIVLMSRNLPFAMSYSRLRRSSTSADVCLSHWGAIKRVSAKSHSSHRSIGM